MQVQVQAQAQGLYHLAKLTEEIKMLVPVKDILLEPVHLQRNLDTQVPEQEPWMQILYKHILPQVDEFRKRYKIQWIDNQIEESKAGNFMNIVIPKIIWTASREVFDKAGFVQCHRTWTSPSADGLKDALLGGSDFNKQWR